MTYADSTTIKKRLDTYENDSSLTDDLITESIETAELIVNGMLGITTSLTDPDGAILKAANLFACADLLDVLFDNEDEVNPVVVRYENKAKIILKPYLSG